MIDLARIMRNLELAVFSIALPVSLLLGGCRPDEAPPQAPAAQVQSEGPSTKTTEYAPVPQRVQWVDPMVGTGGHGHTFPGATVPFGMVQLSPDTRLTGWDGCSGYHHSDTAIYGFSHTHLSGTGISDYGDILMLPTMETAEQASARVHGDPQAVAFDRNTEKAHAGYYKVALQNGVEVELTATPRVGVHQIRFPKSDSAEVAPRIFLDLAHRDDVLGSSLRVINDREIAGYRRSSAWAKDQVVYFRARFSHPFVLEEVQSNSALPQGGAPKASLKFDIKTCCQALTAKVAISPVDDAGALKNLEAEAPHWDFAQYKSEAEQNWDRALAKVQVQGGDLKQHRTFYSALYHTMIAPNVYGDVDGRFRSTDLKVHENEGFTNHTIFSLWDTFRAAHPLYTIIDRKRTVDFIKTFLAHHRYGGKLPMWELAGNYTHTMIGYHSIPVIVDAYFKGIRDYDVEAVYQAMLSAAEGDDFGLDAYRKHGYVPADDEFESVSKTLEYAYDDWCIARMAKALGKEADYQKFMKRSQGWKNLFDPETGFMRARKNGGWFEPFDPTEVNFHFTEANAWQYAFFVPQDVPGMAAAFGGTAGLEAKLDEHFTTSSDMGGRHQADITGLIGQYAHGNEPSHHVAYLYNYLGKPEKSQSRLRQIMDQLYSDTPDGLSGNEDCGQMSAWYVLSALGLYSVTPGRPEYALGTPLFPEASIQLENGKSFRIVAQGVSKNSPYVQSATLNGQPLSGPFVAHDALMAGGELKLVMGAAPNPNFGRAAWVSPEAELEQTAAQAFVAAPIVKAESRSFRGKMQVELKSLSPDAKLYYTVDGSEPTQKSKLYKKPITISKSTDIKVVAFRDSSGTPVSSSVVHANFVQRPDDRSVSIQSKVTPQYAAGGPDALVDGVRGGDDFRTGEWQGYEGQDFDAVVDLKKVRSVSYLGAGFLQDVRSWIWLPRKLSFSLSKDGKNYEEVLSLDVGGNEKDEEVSASDFGETIKKTQVRYVKIHVQSFGTVPQWHPGRGGKSHLFIDEIIVK